VNLLIDIGNARMKWALLENTTLMPSGCLSHSEDPVHAIMRMLDNIEQPVGRVVVANVAGNSIASALGAEIRRRFGLTAEFAVTRAEQLGVHCGYDDPSALGVDRWIGTLAAHHLARQGGRPRAVCTIDAGTAATFDAVDSHGCHLGGLILAGRGLLASMLASSTSDIGPPGAEGHAKWHDTEELLGRTTEAAIRNAAWLALAAAFDRAVRVVGLTTGEPPCVVVTGGDGEGLLGWLETEASYRADLVLEGLALVCNDTAS
jgi:type III pantothenate kinase